MSKTELVDIPQKLFLPHRIEIMKLLRLKKSVSGKELRDALNISDGFLWSHIRALEVEGLLRIEKEIIDNRKVKTSYSITDNGIQIYDRFRKLMLKILQD